MATFMYSVFICSLSHCMRTWYRVLTLPKWPCPSIPPEQSVFKVSYVGPATQGQYSDKVSLIRRTSRKDRLGRIACSCSFKRASTAVVTVPRSEQTCTTATWSEILPGHVYSRDMRRLSGGAPRRKQEKPMLPHRVPTSTMSEFRES